MASITLGFTTSSGPSSTTLTLAQLQALSASSTQTIKTDKGDLVRPATTPPPAW